MRRALAALCSGLVLACGAAEAPPNLVLLIGDDHGYPDFGFMGSPHAQTPRLDGLAAEGTVFRVGYSTASVCRPALRTLLTGLEPLQYMLRERRLRAGRGDVSPEDVVRTIETLPRLLGGAGYASFQAGKHLEGHYAAAGFGEGMIVESGKAGRAAGNRILRETLDPVFDFIDRHAEEPFLLWFAPNVPHIPHDPPEEFRRLYRGSGLSLRARGYFASVSWFDDAAGRIVDHLEARGLGGRTLVVYLADNGWDTSEEPDPDSFLLGGPRGKKSLHELGLRTPIVFRWPGRVTAGAVRDDLVSIVDLLPTLLDYAGVPTPAGRRGESLRPALESGPAPRRRQVVGSMDGLRSDEAGKPKGGWWWRSPRWHLLVSRQHGNALYDVRMDPGEERDVARAHPGVVRRGLDAIRTWQREIAAAARAELR